MKHFHVEVFFRKSGVKSEGLDETPDLDSYASNTELLTIPAASKESMTKKVLIEFPTAAYLYIIDVRSESL